MLPVRRGWEMEWVKHVDHASLDLNGQSTWKLKENKAKNRDSLFIAINFDTSFYCCYVI